jgi:hypothetical protein
MAAPGCAAETLSQNKWSGAVAQGPDQSPPQWEKIEQIAAKYFSVWIWSIVIGITTSASFSLIGYVPRARGSLFLLLLTPLLVLSAAAILASWVVTLRYLDRYVIPIFFGEDEAYRVDPKAQRLLSSAIRYSLLALAFRLILSIVDYLLSSSPNF